MTDAERLNRIGPKLSILARMRGISQKEIARQCNISRISVNRFFQGRTELRASDFINVMNVLGLDVNKDVDMRLQGIQPQKQDLYIELANLLVNLDDMVRKTVVEQITWWGESGSNETARKAASRLREQLRMNSI